MPIVVLELQLLVKVLQLTADCSPARRQCTRARMLKDVILRANSAVGHFAWVPTLVRTVASADWILSLAAVPLQKELLAKGHRVLVFSQSTVMLDMTEVSG